MVENIRRKIGKKEPGKRLKPQQWLLDLLWNSLRKNARRNPGEKGWTFYYCRKEGHLKWDYPQASKPPSAPGPVCKGPHWRRDCPLWCRPQGLDSKDNQGWRFPGVPTQAPVLTTPDKPWVLITVEGQSVDFFWTLGQISLCPLKPMVCFPLHPLL